MARLRAMIEAARSEPGIPITLEELDQRPWLLNVMNGTVHLRTGELHQHDPNNLLTNLAPTEYHSEAICPRWLQFLDEVMASNDAMIGYLQRALGLSLSGSTREDVFFILHGSGANGKTTFMETIRSVVGDDYAQQAPIEMLLARRPGGIPSDIARLRGARFVTATEIPEGRRLDEAITKHLTGHDTITARHLYGEWFQFTATHKLWIATNHRPVIRETSLAMWRRIHLVPFTVTIPEPNQDKELLEKLKAEAEGILAWMMEGCLAWQRNGLGTPHEVHQATADYQAEMDTLGSFLNDCCTMESTAKARAGQLYARHREWCESNGERALTSRAFKDGLVERGLKAGRDQRGRFYAGVRLNQ